ncbi:restriction endonuclease subunit S [Burkholderia ubonensis]|uniref:restriction endonuclease subunit S n=1 Tax=Burkholderia ubonensis TaxID=101571 RepID=UPI0008FDF87E|nr:restriction endonuclease subunit S [Burkholderia ubonensis]
MQSEWRAVRLGDHCIKIGSGATPKGGKESYLETGPYSLIRSQNVYNDGFSWQGLAYISDEQAKKLEGVAVEKNDVLVNITGDSVARVCNAPSAVLPARVNQHVAIVRPHPESFDSDYLRWYLCLPEQQEKLLGLASAGATRNALTKAMLEGLLIPQPPIDVQKSMAALPVAISQRIDLLRQTNSTLESIAQALFKSWFIDFDPVRAKAEGREPEGMDAETAALFPDSFENSTLGEIPKAWRVAKLGEYLTELFTGRRPKGGVAGILEGVPSIGAESINGLGIFDLSKLKYVPRDFFDAMRSGKPQDFDVLLYKDGGKPGHFMPRLGMFGKGFPFTEYAINEHVFGLRAQASLGQPFLYFWMLREATLDRLRGLGNKAAIPGINRGDVEGLPLLVPSEQLATRFSACTLPIIEKILENAKTAATLSKLRDTLLPRLISGKLRVPEAEAKLNEALA